MRETPEKPVFGPETAKLDPPNPPRIKWWRSVAKAISWRTVGTLDTLVLSYLLITYLGPLLGLAVAQGDAIQTASYIALTEVVTKMVFYYLHERGWAAVAWGSFIGPAGRRRETLRRTTTKTVSWRTIASLDTIALAWFYTGNIGTALSIGGLEIFTKMLLYFVHERVWGRLPFGITHRPPVPPPPHALADAAVKKAAPRSVMAGRPA
ncbi:DUF2061 domain-containing protein [Sphingorhabdus soli]|uniref:DUF2061 domain-containing protein n=1 Tax=Flavisphingopyxis soli TaxID=2601267 RepID=A0A5C6U8L8_9SPHN|nr:DUF2061 domain-containing protein [Sphingorhabdus soli]TXC68166.1 DUF2061 domain-containing protein [Sphingorhabdus soli]